jgi:hypothetical protein
LAERKGTHLEWNSVDSMELHLAECLEVKTAERKETTTVVHWDLKLAFYLERTLVEMLDTPKVGLLGSQLAERSGYN